jgi:Arc/MetJ-type ribon-helix-helix transcriptional regulator
MKYNTFKKRFRQKSKNADKYNSTRIGKKYKRGGRTLRKMKGGEGPIDRIVEALEKTKGRNFENRGDFVRFAITHMDYKDSSSWFRSNVSLNDIKEKLIDVLLDLLTNENKHKPFLLQLYRTLDIRDLNQFAIDIGRQYKKKVDPQDQQIEEFRIRREGTINYLRKMKETLSSTRNIDLSKKYFLGLVYDYNKTKREKTSVMNNETALVDGSKFYAYAIQSALTLMQEEYNDEKTDLQQRRIIQGKSVIENQRDLLALLREEGTFGLIHLQRFKRLYYNNNTNSQMNTYTFSDEAARNKFVKDNLETFKGLVQQHSGDERFIEIIEEIVGDYVNSFDDDKKYQKDSEGNFIIENGNIVFTDEYNKAKEVSDLIMSDVVTSAGPFTPFVSSYSSTSR